MLVTDERDYALTYKPGSLLNHDASSSEHGPPRRLPILYWRSKARTSSGNPSWPTRRGTRPLLVLMARD